jgi:ABC-2 type transport system ATP-binding protein
MMGQVTADAAIEVEGLRKAYGDHEAVRGLTFTVARGEVYGLLGPNGAGKTTTVEILEGYRERTAGRVSVLGMDPGDRPAALRERVGIVLQSSGLYRHLTVREAVAHWAGLYPAPRDVDETIALTGLAASADVRTRALSGGQQRRLDFALALIGDPELVFLDEPTTGFDPAARRQAWEVVRSLQALGKTVLLTTHYLDEAQALADRVAIVKDGAMLAEGAPRELGAGASRYRVSWRDGAGDEQVRDTQDPTALLHALTSEALARGERLEELNVSRPSLEDVYLELTAEAVAPAADPAGERMPAAAR